MSKALAGHARQCATTEQPSMRRIRVCVIGLGGGGFHWEAQKVIGAVRRPMELVLVYAGPGGGLIYWDNEDQVRSTYVARSPSLTGDRLPDKLLGVIQNVLQACRILLKEHPDVVLAVGTAQAVPFGIAARLLRKRMWFAESITRMKVPSRTARWIVKLGLASRLYFYSTDLAKYFPRGICMERTRP